MVIFYEINIDEEIADMRWIRIENGVGTRKIKLNLFLIIYHCFTEISSFDDLRKLGEFLQISSMKQSIFKVLEM